VGRSGAGRGICDLHGGLGESVSLGVAKTSRSAAVFFSLFHGRNSHPRHSEADPTKIGRGICILMDVMKIIERAGRAGARRECSVLAQLLGNDSIGPLHKRHKNRGVAELRSPLAQVRVRHAPGTAASPTSVI
jgi:hypothetical protein